VHLRESDIEENEILEPLQRICDATSNCCLTWSTIYWTGTQNDFPLNFTTLIIASYFGIELVVRLQLKVPNIKIDSVDDIYQRSALSWASENGFEGVVKLLIKGPKIPFIKALKNFKNAASLSLLKGAKVNARDKQGRTPLFYATWNGHLAIVKRLVKAGARVDLQDEIGGTPISYALSIGQEDIANELTKEVQADSIDKIRRELLLSAARGGHEPIVKRLLDSGAYTEVIDDNDNTPLCLAVKHVAVIRLLLEKGANVNASDREGRTPLINATAHATIKTETVEVLLKQGADVNARETHSRQTPLTHAIEKGKMDIVKMLLQHGAKKNYTFVSKKTQTATESKTDHSLSSM
jgi:ankyrin repeat protein